MARDQNTEPEVVGYNIYYRTKNPAFPHSGTSLPEGDSPIFFEDEASSYLPLDLPYDGSIYYFTATAVNDVQIESRFSDIVASEWIPYLIAPTNNVAIGTAATFAWISLLKDTTAHPRNLQTRTCPLRGIFP